MSSIDPLCCSPGRELLAQWEENEEYRHLSPMELSLAIRAQTDDPATASAIASQLQLRTQAEGKFGSLARTMLWTRDGYEQATRWLLAREHAARFVKAGATHIGDLGCGIGADSLAFACAGMRVTSYDINDEALSAARENLSSFPSARVEKRDVSTLGPEDFEAEGFDALFADPARRTGKQGGSKRISSPSDWSPSLDRVLSWAQSVPRLGVKVAPGIPYELIPSQFHARWTSVDGDLLEAALWSPSLASEGAGRSACVITRDEIHTLEDPQTASADSPARQAIVGQLGSYLYEP
ncbi:MAG: class I SAM-dependent methyltransferase, partial [Actinomyces sp.]|nr:class I SAM-dependent methyltransferase [Actinomyces sp.]